MSTHQYHICCMESETELLLAKQLDELCLYCIIMKIKHSL